MTTPTRLERTLPAILDELAAGPTPEYLDDVFARTAPMRQRPGWTFPERWLPMADLTRSRAFVPTVPWRLLAVALVVIALVVVAALAYVGAQRRVPAPFGPARNGLIPYEQNGDIYVGDPVTGVSRLVLAGAGTDSAPDFSPDGTLIAYMHDADTDHPSIYTVRPDGSDVRLVSEQRLSNVRWAMWAPDSRHLLVIDVENGTNRLQSLDVTGREEARRLAANMVPDSVVYRPPDADEILFRAYEGSKPGLYVMDADGLNIRTLIKPQDLGDLHLGSLAYSPDGSRIFYQKAFTAEEAATTPFPDNMCCKLWVMNADGTDAHAFTSSAESSWDGLGQPSPDGRWIALWHVTSKAHLGVMRADGTGSITDVSLPLDGNAGWTWAPDSTSILMVPSDNTTAQQSYLLDPAGGPTRTIPWRVPVSPDWQRLAIE